MAEKPSPPPQQPRRARRWSVPRTPAAGSSNRTLFRLIALPALAFAGVLIYRGINERFTLPDCTSSRAVKTLSEVLNQLKTEVPLGNDAIKTISSSKDQVVCNAALALSGGGVLNVDYTFFWQGSAVDMRYSISRRPAQTPPAQTPPAEPPQVPKRTE